MPLNRVTEMMTKVRVGNYNVRVWSIAKEGDFGSDNRVLDALYGVGHLGATSTPALRKKIIDDIEALGSAVVAAYEILDDAGDGVVVYPDWK